MTKTSPSVLLLWIGFAAISLLILDSCDSSTRNPEPTSYTKGNIDSILFVQAHLASQDFKPYQNKDTIRRSSSASAHSPYFKVRFNAVARTVLGSDGKLLVGRTFPEGSIVVKELYNDPAGPRQFVAILKKENTNPYSEGGWLWNEMLADGGAYVSAKDKGALCVSCHSSNSRDFIRTFDLF